MAATADDLRARALRLLARREYSRQELASKLLSKPMPHPKRQNPRQQEEKARANEFAPDPHVGAVYEPPTEVEVHALLDDLEQRKMLSDNRYAEMRTRLRAPRYGDSRLRQELAQKGIDRDTITAVIAEQPDELSRCREIWLKKFGRLPQDMNERAKQIRHLASRGFAMRIIQQVIRGEGRTDGTEDIENSLD
ncbi:MAG: regulatory protein RecX [Fluviibacter sp.]